MVILGPVRDLPRHGRPRAARLLPALLLLRTLSGPPLLPRRLAARQVIRARRHRGGTAAPRRPATVASSAAICSACAAISCACSRISASRGSSDGFLGGTSVTARNH